VGALDQAEAAVAGDASLGAALLRHEVLLRRAQPREALRQVRDAVDEAPENDPYFKDALLVLAQLTAGQGRLRGAQRFITLVTDLDPDFRREEVERVRRGIALLQDG
jgi:ATP/maltotriose-dependent transcriptional regulator MalT